MTAENDAGLVEQIARVIVEHQRIPTFERDGEKRCSGCDHLRGEPDGANSPRHARHVAEQIVARFLPPEEAKP